MTIQTEIETLEGKIKQQKEIIGQAIIYRGKRIEEWVRQLEDLENKINGRIALRIIDHNGYVKDLFSTDFERSIEIRASATEHNQFSIKIKRQTILWKKSPKSDWDIELSPHKTDFELEMFTTEEFQKILDELKLMVSKIIEVNLQALKDDLDRKLKENNQTLKNFGATEIV